MIDKIDKIDKIDVLVVGAGPTGLTLAIDLARRGVAVRIIDQATTHFQGSRGKGLQPRSLEVLADLGVGTQIAAHGWTVPVRMSIGNAPPLEKPPGAALILPQWTVEEVLRARLAEFGVGVELGSELVGFEQDADGVTATTTSTGPIRASYLVGCDGGHSRVRKTLGVAFTGETADSPLMLLGDVEVTGLTSDAAHMWIDPERGMFALTPFRTVPQWQLQAVALDAGQPSLTEFQRLCDGFTADTAVRLSSPTWISSYRVNVRMVHETRVGRVFLAGDAAHVHSPVGGLGMNTGIQDAYNLGWKLAAAVAGTASAALLDTYAAERVPVAEWTLGTSTQGLRDVGEAITTGTGAIDKAVKEEHRQLGISYRNSPLSRQLVAWDGPLAGDRAPWQEQLDGTGFTLLGFGTGAAAALAAVPGVRSRPMPGGHDDALVLVRPDGHIGMVAGPDDAKAVADYVARP